MMTPQVISWMNVEQGDPDYDPEADQFDHRLLAEGDSWFSLGGIPTSNLLYSLRLPHRAIVVNCAKPGDTIRRMGQVAANTDLREAMSHNFGYAWDLILLSGGGNDLIDDAVDIVRPRSGPAGNPASWCDEARLLQTLDDVEQGYRRIVAMRDRADSSCPGVPVVTHTYDWVTPRNAPANFLTVPFFGPWLYTAVLSAGVPESMWNPVSDYLLGRLRDALKALAKGPDRLPNFHVVVTQGTLVRAEMGVTLESNDWMNEIHPNYGGYRKLASKIGRRVRNILDQD